MDAIYMWFTMGTLFVLSIGTGVGISALAYLRGIQNMHHSAAELSFEVIKRCGAYKPQSLAEREAFVAALTSALSTDARALESVPRDIVTIDGMVKWLNSGVKVNLTDAAHLLVLHTAGIRVDQSGHITLSMPATLDEIKNQLDHYDAIKRRST
ncbi:TPA: hypothetical protein RNS96_000288 [Stenotrophomonas maltophilia]|nr:hypothetical protein [Stenotrophomonas maltophilia]